VCVCVFGGGGGLPSSVGAAGLLKRTIRPTAEPGLLLGVGFACCRRMLSVAPRWWCGGGVQVCFCVSSLLISGDA